MSFKESYRNKSTSSKSRSLENAYSNEAGKFKISIQEDRQRKSGQKSIIELTV